MTAEVSLEDLIECWQPHTVTNYCQCNDLEGVDEIRAYSLVQKYSTCPIVGFVVAEDAQTYQCLLSQKCSRAHTKSDFCSGSVCFDAGSDNRKLIDPQTIDVNVKYELFNEVLQTLISSEAALD